MGIFKYLGGEYGAHVGAQEGAAIGRAVGEEEASKMLVPWFGRAERKIAESEAYYSGYVSEVRRAEYAEAGADIDAGIKIGKFLGGLW